MYLGYVVMLGVPPPIALVPFTRILGGDVRIALVSNMASYLVSLAVLPLALIFFAGVGGAGFGEVLQPLLLLILAPLLLSRFLPHVPGYGRLDRWRSAIVNVGLFVVIYTVVGLNRSYLVGAEYLLPVGIIAVARTFGTGGITYLLAKGVDEALRVPLTLAAAFKNMGLGAAWRSSYSGLRRVFPRPCASCVRTCSS